jgi:hypothetical protein
LQVDDHLGAFVRRLSEEGNAYDNLLVAVNAIVSERSSELSRVLRALSIDLPAALRAAPDGWRPDAANPGNFASTVLLRAASFTRELRAPDDSSAVLAHAFLRSHAEAVTQVQLAVVGYQPLPPLVRIRAITRAAAEITRAAALSWHRRLPERRIQACRPRANAVDVAAFEDTAFGQEVLYRARRQSRQLGGTRPLSSKAMVRAAMAVGAEQRVALWLQGLGYNSIDMVRGDLPADVEPGRQDAELTLVGIGMVGVAHRLGELAGQIPELDRIMLAGLVTPGSFPWRQAVAAVGSGVNLPLLYLRSARPASLTREEVEWLVEVGDAQADRDAVPLVGDISVERFANLRLEAQSTTRAYDAAERLRNFARAAGGLPAAATETQDITLRAAQTGGLRYFALATGDACDAGQGIREAFTNGRLPATGAINETRAVFDRLRSADPVSRLMAREQLAAVQPDQLSRRLLLDLEPSIASECVRAADEDPDAERVWRLVRLQLALGMGLPPGPRVPHSSHVRVCIGGGPTEFGCAILSSGQGETWRFSTSIDELLREWVKVRQAALADNPMALRESLEALASTLGFTERASMLRGSIVDLFVVPPFDALFVDLAIRSVSRPLSITYRVAGGVWGTWQQSLKALEQNGGRKVFVADPTASLVAARLEAEWLAVETGGEVVTGKMANRARVVRSLEADYQPAQLLHFTGHGASGVINADGEAESAVVVGEGEFLRTSALADHGVPRVLITAACDVGAVPPAGATRGWHRSAIMAGVGYSVASSIPIADAGAMAFSLMLYHNWRESDRLELAVARTCALGASPKELHDALRDTIANDQARNWALQWLKDAAAADVEQLFSAFSIAAV